MSKEQDPMTEEDLIFERAKFLISRGVGVPQSGSSAAGAHKIKDGIIVGDESTAKDLQFIVDNRITHIINCAGIQVKNMWEQIGIKYLRFKWLDIEG